MPKLKDIIIIAILYACLSMVVVGDIVIVVSSILSGLFLVLGVLMIRKGITRSDNQSEQSFPIVIQLAVPKGCPEYLVQTLRAAIDEHGENFEVDPSRPYESFKYIQRHLIMRLRGLDAPEDSILYWKLWDGRQLSYKLREAEI